MGAGNTFDAPADLGPPEPVQAFDLQPVEEPTSVFESPPATGPDVALKNVQTGEVFHVPESHVDAFLNSPAGTWFRRPPPRDPIELWLERKQQEREDDAWLRQQRQAWGSPELLAHQAAHSGLTPDQAAEALKLSQKTGFAPAWVGRNLDAVRKRVELDELRATFRAITPRPPPVYIVVTDGERRVVTDAPRPGFVTMLDHAGEAWHVSTRDGSDALALKMGWKPTLALPYVAGYE